MRTREDVAELVMKIFDRLGDQFPGTNVEDAIILVELSDPDDKITLDDGREVPSTLVLLECTSDRVVVQAGIMDFAQKLMYERGAVDPDDDE
jgi:hypothetical protein